MCVTYYNGVEVEFEGEVFCIKFTPVRTIYLEKKNPRNGVNIARSYPTVLAT